MAQIQEVESDLSEIAGAAPIKSLLEKSRRTLKGDTLDRATSSQLLRLQKRLTTEQAKDIAACQAFFADLCI